KFAHAGAGGAGNGYWSLADAGTKGCGLLGQLTFAQEIELIECNDLGLVDEARAIGLKLTPDGSIGCHRIPFARIDHMQEHRTSLDMAEKPGAQSGAVMGTSNEPGNVGEHEGRFGDPNHSQTRREGGEWVIGNLWAGSTDARQQRRFSCVRQPDNSYIG